MASRDLQYAGMYLMMGKIDDSILDMKLLCLLEIIFIRFLFSNDISLHLTSKGMCIRYIMFTLSKHCVPQAAYNEN